jgi:hypothetical protein
MRENRVNIGCIISGTAVVPAGLPPDAARRDAEERADAGNGAAPPASVHLRLPADAWRAGPAGSRSEPAQTLGDSIPFCNGDIFTPS